MKLQGTSLNKKVGHLISGFLVTLLTVNHAQAAQLNIDSKPLFVQNSAQSNLIFAIDDSGSMEAETQHDTYDGYIWFKDSAASTIDSSTDSPYVKTENSRRYIYLTPNGTATGSRIYTDHYGLPPFPQYGYARSSDFNSMYYNPMLTYEPWYNGGTDTYSDMSTTAAESDPSVSGATTINLTTSLKSNSSGWDFRIGPGAVMPKDTVYYDGSSWATRSSNYTYSSVADVFIEYFPATYYVKTTSGSYSFAGSSGTVAGNCSSPDPDHYSEFELNPTLSSIGVGVHALAYDGSCLERVEIKTSVTSYAANHNQLRTDCSNDSYCTYDEEIQNFANWFSYHRKRHLALRASIGSAFATVNSFNAGYFTINSRNDVTMEDLSDSTEKASFYDDIYAIKGRSAGTPNRQALKHAGEQFKRTNSGAPIQYSCQKNFALLFTDGYTSVDSISDIGDEDSSSYSFADPTYDANGDGSIDASDKGLPYLDTTGTEDSLADIAFHYYNETLRQGTGFEAGNVSTDTGCELDTPDASLDCNSNLHMNTYTVGFGHSGTIFGVTHFDVDDAYAVGGAPSWPTATVRDERQIDDLYHAAVNGRGEIFNAASADDLTDKLSAALGQIQLDEGSASSVSFNTATLESDSNVFLALFNPSLWSGDLQAFSLDSLGNISDTAAWSAADYLNDSDNNNQPTYDSRVILSHSGSQGIAFRWANLSSDQQDDLNANSCSSCTGEDVLNYIRGDQTNEGASKLRERESLLGDIVNGGPIYVGLPNLSWPSEAPFPTVADGVEETYAYFKEQQVNSSTIRDSIVYFGANDGMLHGFIAEDNDGDNTNEEGQEVLAYIPSVVYSDQAGEGLHYLSDVTYQHQFYVDQTPAVADAYFQTSTASTEKDWKTVLIGGLGAGGRGIYALDITDPSSFTEANASSIVLWEFTSSDSSDLGYTFSKPTIAMMENGRFAAVFGNGYNSDSELAKLFVVFIDGGIDGTWTDGSGSTDTDYIVIGTDSTTSNGLSSVRLLDTDGNGAVDRVYGGDLQGRMWAFDLSDDSNTSNWAVAYKQGSTPKPLFTATDSTSNPQPITSKPAVVYHPVDATSGSNKPNLMVFFGTGSFLETADITSTDTQTFYGIHDTGSGDLARSDLLAQTMSNVTATILGESRTYRTISNNTLTTEDGWYVDLPSSGERSVVDSVPRGDNIWFNTWIPNTDPCDAGGSGYLLTLSQINGGPPSSPAFDINEDGVVDSNDTVSGVVPIGEEFTSGLPSTGKFLSNKQYTTGSGTNQILVRDVEDLGGVTTGRLSWQELNP